MRAAVACALALAVGFAIGLALSSGGGDDGAAGEPRPAGARLELLGAPAVGAIDVPSLKTPSRTTRRTTTTTTAAAPRGARTPAAAPARGHPAAGGRTAAAPTASAARRRRGRPAPGMIATGTKLGGYRVERLLGSGGMGTVYLATQESLNRPVALKLLNPSLTSDETFRARFRREGEVQAALDHPHIVPVYEAGESDEGLFLAMRFVRGSTLKDLVDAGELDPARTLRLLTPVASALDAAHAAGLIHRDVKPQNILVDQTDWPYLADFGLTRGGAGGPTRTGQLVGTFAYVAPEQVQGHKASARSDQYALAAVLFECLTGEVPHNQDSDAALLYAKVHQEPPRLSARAADLPAGLDDVLARGMSRDPDERFPSASALLAAAAEALERGDEPEPAPAPPPPRAQPGAPAPRPRPAATARAAWRAGAAPAPPAPRAQPDARPAQPARTQDTVLVDGPPALPVEAPAPPAAPKRVRRPKPRVALSPPRFVRDPRAVALAALAAAALGVLAGTALGGGDEPAATKAAAGDLGTFAVPAGMRPARGPAGLGLDELQVYAQGADAHARRRHRQSGRAQAPARGRARRRRPRRRARRRAHRRRAGAALHRPERPRPRRQDAARHRADLGRRARRRVRRAARRGFRLLRSARLARTARRRRRAACRGAGGLRRRPARGAHRVRARTFGRDGEAAQRRARLVAGGGFARARHRRGDARRRAGQAQRAARCAGRARRADRRRRAAARGRGAARVGCVTALALALPLGRDVRRERRPAPAPGHRHLEEELPDELTEPFPSLRASKRLSL